VLARRERTAGVRPAPDEPEHDYQYDPGKANAYVAVCFAIEQPDDVEIGSLRIRPAVRDQQTPLGPARAA
jgi:hypothetical protein